MISYQDSFVWNIQKIDYTKLDRYRARVKRRGMHIYNLPQIATGFFSVMVVVMDTDLAPGLCEEPKMTLSN